MNEQMEADIAGAAWRVGQAADVLAQQIGGYHATWFSVMRPRLFKDGNMWCALFGENLAEGVAGFGETPAKAMWAFDTAWHTTNGSHIIPRTEEKDNG